MKAIAIILAAGESLRMGRPKALLEASPGVSFVERLSRTFAEAGLVPLVVTGANADAIRAAHPGLKAVLNARWPDGQLSSARVGLRAALAQGADRILIHPVDAPLIAPDTARAVLAALEEAPLALATFEGRPGHPLGLRSEAARTVLDSTAATLEGAIAALVCAHVSVLDSAVLDNLNKPEAYQARLGHLPNQI